MLIEAFMWNGNIRISTFTRVQDPILILSKATRPWSIITMALFLTSLSFKFENKSRFMIIVFRLIRFGIIAILFVDKQTCFLKEIMR